MILRQTFTGLPADVFMVGLLRGDLLSLQYVCFATTVWAEDHDSRDNTALLMIHSCGIHF